MDKELTALLQQPECRVALCQALLQSCFSPEIQRSLSEQAEINARAYDYSQDLERRAHLHLVQETIEADKYQPAVREQGFRRIVVTSYDHRCALCGVRIVTSEGHSVVDAAHIIPWRVSHNDDIRNGMALCKMCHWAFDRGMMGVSADYSVILSPQIRVEPNFPGLLFTLTERRIISPTDQDMWPAQENLLWHRQEFRLP